MWSISDTWGLWTHVIEEAYARKGVSGEDLALWVEYCKKCITLMERFVRSQFTWDDETKRMKDEIVAMVRDVEDVKRRALSNVLGFAQAFNENAVVFAFGRLYKFLEPVLAEALIGEDGFDRLEFKAGYPDAEIAKGGKRLRVEFEVRSSEFKRHEHDERGCDLIICWMHDWHDCPLKAFDMHELYLYERESTSLLNP
jgi:hypothetical protein